MADKVVVLDASRLIAVLGPAEGTHLLFVTFGVRRRHDGEA
jgi:hypothetical protein